MPYGMYVLCQLRISRHRKRPHINPSPQLECLGTIRDEVAIFDDLSSAH